MRLELKKEGVDVYIAAINKRDATGQVTALTNRCSYPVLQDLDTVQAWDLHMFGHKDDFYVYRADGKLYDYLPVMGDRDTNLSMPEGYNNVKNVLKAAAKASVDAATGGADAGSTSDAGSSADAASGFDGGASDVTATSGG